MHTKIPATNQTNTKGGKERERGEGRREREDQCIRVDCHNDSRRCAVIIVGGLLKTTRWCTSSSSPPVSDAGFSSELAEPCPKIKEHSFKVIIIIIALLYYACVRACISSNNNKTKSSLWLSRYLVLSGLFFILCVCACGWK